MIDTDNVNVETNKTEKIVLGFCSKFQPQLAPHAVGPGKTLINYKIHYFPCMGDKCTDSWCHIDQMCRHRCEHEIVCHSEVGEDGEDSINSGEENIIDEDIMENDRAGR